MGHDGPNCQRILQPTRQRDRFPRRNHAIPRLRRLRPAIPLLRRVRLRLRPRTLTRVRLDRTPLRPERELHGLVDR